MPRAPRGRARCVPHQPARGRQVLGLPLEGAAEQDALQELRETYARHGAQKPREAAERRSTGGNMKMFMVIAFAFWTGITFAVCERPAPARADDAAALQRITLAIEANARATQELVRATKEKCR
jgi:hypothetical protein